MVARYLTLSGDACVWPGRDCARRHDETDLVAWSDGFERCLSSGYARLLKLMRGCCESTTATGESGL